MQKSIGKTIYHSILRVSVCVCALALIFDSGLLSSSTAKLSSDAQNYVASAVGVKVGVSPNDVNILTTKITELEQELAVRDREISVNLDNNPSTNTGFDMSTFILSVILFILLVLIVMNYVLDYVRERVPRTNTYRKATQ